MEWVLEMAYRLTVRVNVLVNCALSVSMCGLQSVNAKCERPYDLKQDFHKKKS